MYSMLRIYTDISGEHKVPFSQALTLALRINSCPKAVLNIYSSSADYSNDPCLPLKKIKHDT